MPTTTANMLLTIPSFGDPSPTYVNNLTQSLTLLDAHDHTAMKGTLIPAAGLNINGDVSFQGNSVNAARSVRFTPQGATLAGASDYTSTYVVGGDLYYNNAAGFAVKLTAGNALNTAGGSGIGGDYAAVGAQLTYADTTKRYSFFTGTPGVYADIFAGNFAGIAAAPFIDLRPLGTGTTQYWRLSSDGTGLRVSGTLYNNTGVDARNGYSLYPTQIDLSPNSVALGGSATGAPAHLTVYGRTTGATPTVAAVNTTGKASITLTGISGAGSDNFSTSVSWTTTGAPAGSPLTIAQLNTAGSVAYSMPVGTTWISLGTPSSTPFIAFDIARMGLGGVPRSTQTLSVYGSTKIGNGTMAAEGVTSNSLYVVNDIFMNGNLGTATYPVQNAYIGTLLSNGSVGTLATPVPFVYTNSVRAIQAGYQYATTSTTLYTVAMCNGYPSRTDNNTGGSRYVEPAITTSKVILRPYNLAVGIYTALNLPVGCTITAASVNVFGPATNETLNLKIWATNTTGNVASGTSTVASGSATMFPAGNVSIAMSTGLPLTLAGANTTQYILEVSTSGGGGAANYDLVVGAVQLTIQSIFVPYAFRA